MSSQPSLFPLGPAEPLPLPKGSKPASKPATYTDYFAQGQRCQDCDELIYQLLMEGRKAPHVRRARVKRTEGTDVRYLCHAHAQERRRLDAGGQAAG